MWESPDEGEKTPVTTRALMLPAMLLGLAAHLFAADEAIDQFDAGIESWSSTLPYGDVSRSKLSAGDGVAGGGLQVDYDFRGGETNHIVYFRPVELDLSWAKGVSFQVRGEGDSALLFLFVWDAEGHLNNYGAHGTNHDFRSGYAGWQTLDVLFDDDRSVQGGGCDFSEIRRIGWMVWHMGPAKGTVWIDNLTAMDTDGSLGIRPPVISPNADGVNDAATIIARVPRTSSLTVEVSDADGAAVATLIRDAKPGEKRALLTWDGLRDGEPLPDGQYTVRAAFTGEREGELEASVSLDTTHKWPPIEYENEPFFPIGVWFEGAPGLNGGPGDPEGARKYYDQCFADMAAHGFNAAAVPNCPEHLWEPLLQSAEEHGIKIVLEVAPLAGLVSRKELAGEADVHAAAMGVYEKIGEYDSLLRYQIRDEPPRELVPNWLLVRRILAAVDPKRPAFSCFCHPDSLRIVTDQVDLTEAVVDLYPHRAATPKQSLGSFFSAMDTFKRSIKDNDWWAVLQAFGVPPPSWRYPTPEELRAVTYLSLAEGAKGVFYFIYQYMPDYLWGMVALDGSPQPIYATASQLAQEMQRVSPLLLALEPSDPPDEVEGDVRVGSFVDPEGNSVLIVASTRPDAQVTAAVAVDSDEPWLDAISGESITPRENVLTVPLIAGGGRVLVRP